MEKQKTVKKHYCDRCAKYGNPNSEMITKKLQISEIKEKLLREKLRYDAGFIYLFYNYWECPICHWHKFVEKEV